MESYLVWAMQIALLNAKGMYQKPERFTPNYDESLAEETAMYQKFAQQAIDKSIAEDDDQARIYDWFAQGVDYETVLACLACTPRWRNEPLREIERYITWVIQEANRVYWPE